jgi:hypothetical protein
MNESTNEQAALRLVDRLLAAANRRDLRHCERCGQQTASARRDPRMNLCGPCAADLRGCRWAGLEFGPCGGPSNGRECWDHVQVGRVI